jgi:hypothetical protein
LCLIAYEAVATDGALATYDYRTTTIPRAILLDDIGGKVQVTVVAAHRPTIIDGSAVVELIAYDLHAGIPTINTTSIVSLTIGNGESDDASACANTVAHYH